VSLTIKTSLQAFLKGLALPKGTPLAIGVSGGVDSLTLALLMQEVCQKKYPLYAFIVDHGLRAVAHAEAVQTKKTLENYHIPADILVWTGPKPKTKIEEVAREKRYQLLAEACAKKGIHHLFLAHHAGDQAETFLSRLSHASSLEGLKGMQAICSYQTLTLCRPFLTIEKKDIIQMAQELHLSWAEDEMNQDRHYERVRWRKLLPTLAPYGLTIDKITTSMGRLALAEEALKFYLRVFIERWVIVNPLGYLMVPKKAYQDLPMMSKIKFLQWAIKVIGQPKTPPSFKALEDRAMHLQGPLGGCQFYVKQNKLYVAKETAKMPRPVSVPAETWITWDRFLVWSPTPAVIQTGPSKNKGNKELPVAILKTLPVLKDKKGLEIPVQFHYNKGDRKACVCFSGLKEGRYEI